MTTYQVKTFADIYTAVLEQIKISASDTTSLNRIKRDINQIYLQLMSEESWKFARMHSDVIIRSYYSEGTVSVTNGDRTITLSDAPSESKQDYFFHINGYNEEYRIDLHTAGSDTIELTSEFTGTTSTSTTFKIYQKYVPLPNEMMDVIRAWTDYTGKLMEPLDDESFKKLTLSQPRRADRPRYFTLTDYYEPNEYSSVDSLPTLTTRESDGYVRTLIFDLSVEDYLEIGDQIKIISSDIQDYNGEFTIQEVSTNTISYTATEILTESPTADTNLTLYLKNTEDAYKDVIQLEIYPYLNDEDTTIHVEGMSRPEALEDDDDEPNIPLQYRSVLVCGASELAWRRHRNPEEAVIAYRKYKELVKKMKSKYRIGKDPFSIQVSNLYLRSKRSRRSRTEVRF